MTLETLIAALNREEKLAALDLIWRELASDAQALASPPWHEQILVERQHHPAPGPALPLSEAKAEVKEAMDARRTAR